MANCKSIRLDFPALGLSLSDDELLTLIQDCFIAAATSNTTRARREAAQVLARAVVGAQVNHFDDRLGGPVFYVP